MTAKECIDRLNAMQSKAKEKDREALKIAAFVLEHSVLVPEAGAWALKGRSEDNDDSGMHQADETEPVDQR